MPKLTCSENKILKLTNVLIYKIDMGDVNALQDVNLQIEKMQNYIKVKGSLQIGPFIQYNAVHVDASGNAQVDICMMLQCKDYIHTVEAPYTMEAVVRIPNCMYCRYIGPGDKLRFAYDKINLTAFEEDIPLKGDSYTIFVKQDAFEETITADVFMERADG